MTSDLPIDDEAKAIPFIGILRNAREDAAAARIAEDIAKRALLPVLEAMPEGARELFDEESEPRIGVALRDRPSTRIVEWAAVPEETLLWAAKTGLIKGFDSALYDALAQAMSQSTQHHIAAIRDRIVQGSTPTLVSLPERRRS